MNRNEIDPALTWDLSSMYANQKEYEDDYAYTETLLEKVKAYEGHIADTKASFVSFMDTKEELELHFSNLYTYPHMFCDVDPDNEQEQSNLAKASNLAQKINVSLTFVPLEIIQYKEVIESYLRDEDMKEYRYPIEEIFRTIPHRLDDKTEAILSQVDEIAQVPDMTFESLRLEFEPVEVDGKKEFLNGGTYTLFLLHKDPNVRKEAFEHYFGEYKKYQNVFCNLLIGHVKGQAFHAKMRHFDSALDASLFEDGADRSLFDKVLSMANEKYQDHIHEYFAMRKEILHLDVQHVYDVNLPLVENVDIKYTIDECFAILKEALLPLGEDYVAMLDHARKERWIDFMPHNGKQSGAYSSGTYNSKPFILTNFLGDYRSLSTLAHEFGHSMHTYYSSRANRPMLSNYTLFVAEVASTVNELLLNDYLLKHSDDPKYRAYLLSNLLYQLVGTIYRQPIYAKFEADMYAQVEKGIAISSKELTQQYLDINKAYFGDSVEVDELQRYGCYYIPHFYYNFYVYKYTLGMSVAIAFAKRILNGDVEDYRAFLSKGGSECPIDELIHAGVDPREDHVYDEAFTYFKEILDEFKQCLKQI